MKFAPLAGSNLPGFLDVVGGDGEHCFLYFVDIGWVGIPGPAIEPEDEDERCPRGALGWRRGARVPGEAAGEDGGLVEARLHELQTVRQELGVGATRAPGVRGRLPALSNLPAPRATGLVASRVVNGDWSLIANFRTWRRRWIRA